jgi:hypothetical protein
MGMVGAAVRSIMVVGVIVLLLLLLLEWLLELLLELLYHFLSKSSAAFFEPDNLSVWTV